MLVSMSASPILAFAASLNSLSPLRFEREIDSEFKEAANGRKADLLHEKDLNQCLDL